MNRRGRAGVTLVEMLIVVTIISLMVGISFPSVTSGIETLRMGSACDDVAALFNGALNRAERRQHGIEVAISEQENAIAISSFEPGYQRRVDLPKSIRIVRILPEAPPDVTGSRRFLVFPGGTVPAIGVVLVNTKGDQRMVRIDPISGVPRIERMEPGS